LWDFTDFRLLKDDFRGKNFLLKDDFSTFAGRKSNKTTMAELDLTILYEAYHSNLANTDTTFVRYIYNEINWNARVIGIRGARGVGKTTLLLQRIKLCFAEDYEQALYVSLDNLWFSTNSLMDLVDYLDMRGVRHLFLDEVHKYKNREQTIKNIFDNFPRMNVVYTGSSMLEIDNSKADMSRRQTLYTLSGLSFREFLKYEGLANFEKLSLPDILSRHTNIAMDIASKTDIVKHFENYLRNGFYPFHKEAGADYFPRLREAVNTVIDSDIPAVESFDFETLYKIKKMLMITASQVPFTPNISTLCKQVSTTRNMALKILYLLDRAKLLRLIMQKDKTYDNIVKPDKILLDNPNLMYALASNPEIGTIRETFFACQLASVGTVTSPDKGDYLVCGEYLFEVGGHRKSFKQIKDIPNSYLAIDNTIVGIGNRIPLWLFGFLK